MSTAGSRVNWINIRNRRSDNVFGKASGRKLYLDTATTDNTAKNII